MFGIGYGDYTPFTAAERGLCILIIIAGAAAVSYIVGDDSDLVRAQESRASVRLGQVCVAFKFVHWA